MPCVCNTELLAGMGPPGGPSLHFMFGRGRFLTRQRFVAAVRDALKVAGIECSKYCGHSFRIGAATTAATRGMEDALIKMLGR